MGIFGSIGKALFGGKKKTSSQTTSGVADRSPYAPVIPSLTNYIGKTDALYNGGAPQISDYEQKGYDLLSKVAGNGTGDFFNTAENTLKDTAAGKYLTPDTNPYLADIAKRVSGIAGSTNNATFGGRGRSTGGLAGYYAGKGVGDSLTDLYGSVYESERGRQQGAAALAPEFERSRFVAPQALISAGQNVSARPFDLNQQYGGILSQISSLGGKTTSTGEVKNYQQSPGLFGQILNSFTNKLFPGGQSGFY